jgi:cytochrome c-type biogenesis protein CcmH
MSLFVALALPALLVVALVLWRAQRPRPDPGGAATDADWALMVQRRREIEDDPDLDAQLRETLIAEWQEQAAALQPAAEPPAAGAGQGRTRAWLLPLAVVVAGVGAYAAVSDLSEPALRVQLAGQDAPAQPAAADAAEDLAIDSDTLQQRIAELEKRLQAQPDDVEGWVMLSRSRGLQRDFPAAARALEQAVRLAPDQPDLLADLADTTAMAQGEKMAGRPVELVAQALKIDPGHPKSLALAATAAMQAGQRDNAVKLWRTLQSQFQPGDPSYQQIAEILAQMDVPAAAAATAPAGGASIRGEVALGKAALERLRQQPAPASAVLYVVAKAVDGPPMPLAVLRLPLSDLAAGRKVAFQLDDSLAMSPQLSLSKFRQVSVEARVSMSGNAIREAGDWSAVRSPVAVGSSGLALRIDPAR